MRWEQRIISWLAILSEAKMKVKGFVETEVLH